MSSATPQEKKTEEELKQLLGSYKDGLTYWQQQLSSKTTISQIKASKVGNPVEELIKLCQLIHANTTKMGIIFTKPLKDVNAAYKQTQELSSSSILLISLCIQLIEDDQLSKLFKNEIFAVIKYLLSSLELFVTELINDEDDKRLISVGKIWETVNQLIKISKLGKIGVLKLKLKECTTMIDDGIEELNEWIEDPVAGGDDPFAFSDEEEEEEEPIPSGAESPLVKEDYNDILPDAKNYVTKIKLVKLLIASLTKSVPTGVKDNKLDDIYESCKEFNEIIDELIYKIIFENNLVEASFWFKKMSKKSDDVIDILKLINGKDDKKLKWLDTWTLKFKE